MKFNEFKDLLDDYERALAKACQAKWDAVFIHDKITAESVTKIPAAYWQSAAEEEVQSYRRQIEDAWAEKSVGRIYERPGFSIDD